MKFQIKHLDNYVIIIISLLGVVLTILNSFFNEKTLNDTSDTAKYLIVGIVFFGALLGGILFPKIAKYVEEGTKNSKEDEKSKASGIDITAKAKEQIKALVKEVLENPDPEPFAPIDLDDFDDDELSEDEIKLQLIEEHTYELQMSISQQINKISRSGTTNLMIGLALTVLAITMLILVIYGDEAPAYLFDETTNSGIRFFIHMIPRLSIVLFIEIFSFFFLNLYKRNTDEIKYFNNERTNIESKLIALKMAVVFGNKETINKTIESLYKTDRNSTIKKSETTIEIEKMKIEKSDSENMLDKLLKLSKAFNKEEK
ncbi:hypothetical protein HQ865_19875 [Mucilaginibacter mali]|uniref:Uncharacterized protein n=1 Tax=Mucilaginibacter mali TaxID=2740462 RepID=A0A7D4PVV6_9SPHI|nr:hypothetical protein [Mucilaginibacter mali]QKJ31928.1 hypothetical protein HQ865_19875 [Mucilaginibacter mali]